MIFLSYFVQLLLVRWARDVAHAVSTMRPKTVQIIAPKNLLWLFYLLDDSEFFKNPL